MIQSTTVVLMYTVTSKTYVMKRQNFQIVMRHSVGTGSSIAGEGKQWPSGLIWNLCGSICPVYRTFGSVWQPCDVLPIWRTGQDICPDVPSHGILGCWTDNVDCPKHPCPLNGEDIAWQPPGMLGCGLVKDYIPGVLLLAF